MRRCLHRMRHGIVLAVILCCFQALPSHLNANESPVKMKHFSGALDTSASPNRMILEGEASHLGRFTSSGEVVFQPGEEPGTLVGVGPVVFRAANGDLLVGTMTWSLSALNGNDRTGEIHFRWAESVTFSNGAEVSNTGRFVSDRPPGLITIVITSQTTTTDSPTLIHEKPHR